MSTSTVNRRAALEIRAELGRQARAQRDLAQELGISQTKVSRWLRCATPMNLDDVEHVAEALHVPVAQFLSGAA